MFRDLCVFLHVASFRGKSDAGKKEKDFVENKLVTNWEKILFQLFADDSEESLKLPFQANKFWK